MAEDDAGLGAKTFRIPDPQIFLGSSGPTIPLLLNVYVSTELRLDFFSHLDRYSVEVK